MSRSKQKPKAKAVAPPRHDLVVLAADKDTKEAIDGLLTIRTKALGIRPITHDIITHPQHDPGCLKQSVGLLSVYRRTHRYALAVFDREGSGRETASRIELETTVEAELKAAGWGDRAAVIVIDPELENWIWSPSPHVASSLGWNQTNQSMQEWLVANKWLAEVAQIKPERPKEAMEAVLRLVKKPRSSALYRAISEKVSLVKCTDPAFAKLGDTLRTWFPSANPDH